MRAINIGIPVSIFQITKETEFINSIFMEDCKFYEFSVNL